MRKPQVLLFTVFLCLSLLMQGQKNQLPNVVIIFMDDMGYGDLSSYGAIGYKTPHLDRMAAEGMRFTDFHVPQAVCSASRAAILTGCYSTRVGIGGALFPSSPLGLNPEEETIAEVLKQRGYRTAAFGKWHLGSQPEFLPLQQGFDEFVGLPYSNDMWPLHPSQEKFQFPDLYLIDGNKKTKKIESLEDQAQLTTLYTEKAVSFIRRNKEHPFFLYVPHSMPHVPLAVSQKFQGKSEMGLYGDVMMEIDWSVGQITEALKENGILDNTLVIFTSDNGPWLRFGNHGGSAGGLREGKETSWEGGTRVSCLMRWPGKIPAGSICNKLASTIDILPTLAEITQASLPKRKIDGVNILDLMLGVSDATPRRIFYYYYYLNSLQAVRKDQWKLVFPHPTVSFEGTAPGGDGKPGTSKNVEVGYSLYDMRRDPGERYDVKEYFPEIVEDLKKLGDIARKDLGDKITNTVGENVRKPGKINP